MPTIPRVSGIYAITCTTNNKIYIGSSQNIYKRFAAHCRMLRGGYHHNVKLQRAWDKYGADAFTFRLLEIVPNDILLERELVWMVETGASKPKRGFNLSQIPGAPMRGRNHSIRTRRQFSKSRRGTANANYRGKTKVCAGCGEIFESGATRRRYCSHACYSAAPRSAETRDRISVASRGKPRNSDSVQRSAETRMQWFILTDPNGNTFLVKGLARFCRSHGLDQGSMSRAAQRAIAHKGWKCRRALSSEIP